MIVVLGSRHDVVAARIVAGWPEADLCSAEDLVSPGWVWPVAGSHAGGERTWIVRGRCVSDRDISGVFVRRSAVYAEELPWLHPADRAYLAGEAQALVSLILGTTGALVCNPPVEGGFGEESIGAERWMPAAARIGVPVRKMRVRSTDSAAKPVKAGLWSSIEVVGKETFGNAPARIRKSAGRLAAEANLPWGRFLFDAEERLAAITTMRAPGAAATRALGRLLAGRGPET